MKSLYMQVLPCFSVACVGHLGVLDALFHTISKECYKSLI